MQKKILTLILLIICSNILIYAQSDSTNYALRFRAGMQIGYAYPHNQYAKSLLSGDKLITGANIGIGWKAKGDSVNLSDEMFGRPTIEAGMLMLNYNHVTLHETNSTIFQDRKPSSIGQMITPYAMIRRPLLNTRRVDAGWAFTQGIGICTKPYDKDSNPENYFIGARFAILVGMGVYCDVHIDDNWSIGATALMHHYSNGRLDLPNYGINSFEAGLHATYTPNPDPSPRNPYGWSKNKYIPKDNYRNHFYVETTASWLPRVLLAEWHYTWNRVPTDHPRYRTGSFSYHHSLAFDAALMYQYSRKFASGLGIEYIYAPLGDDIKYWENLNGHDTALQKPHGLSIAAHHEAFYKNIGVHISIGYYMMHEPKQRNDQISPVYETAGIRYYLPLFQRNIFIGYNIRARATTADCFQFALGYKFGGNGRNEHK